ncbi:cation transporter dimerization domain-containing protein [Pedobacter hartonius]|uniref:cation transporter dimerization domain-containing protein n=1 Tax=Pedobacter hartonius TaxID=425514 RepID=UPI00111548A4|nr:cation transporter dimerization domain-containing protein [Pedobacter hartonius]
MDGAPADELIAAITAIASVHTEVKWVEKCFLRKIELQYYVDIHIEVDGTIMYLTRIRLKLSFCSQI